MRIFLIILLLAATTTARLGRAQPMPIPPPPPNLNEDMDEEGDEEEDDEEIDAPMMRPPPIPNPFNQANPNSGPGGAKPPNFGGSGGIPNRSDLGFNRGSGGGSTVGSGITAGPSKLKFKVLDGEFWERGKRRGRAPRGTPTFSGGSGGYGGGSSGGSNDFGDE